MNLIFLKPEAVPEASVLDYKAEHLRHGEDKIHGSALLDALDYAEWLQRVRDNADARTVLAGWAVASTFFAIRETDGRIVGMADIRHSLESAFLRRYGGHIGYGVRPRNGGRATRRASCAWPSTMPAASLWIRPCSAAPRKTRRPAGPSCVAAACWNAKTCSRARLWKSIGSTCGPPRRIRPCRHKPDNGLRAGKEPQTAWTLFL